MRFHQFVPWNLHKGRPRVNASTQFLMLAGPLASSFTDTYSLCHFSDIRLCPSSSIFLPSVPLVRVLPLSILRRVQSILRGRLLWFSSFWWDFFLQSLVSSTFLVSEVCLKYFFVFFFHLHLFDGASFWYSQVHVIFLFFFSFLQTAWCSLCT